MHARNSGLIIHAPPSGVQPDTDFGRMHCLRNDNNMEKLWEHAYQT